MERQAGFDRIVNLSDGVIAIAITLLVLEIKLPELKSKSAEHLGISWRQHSSGLRLVLSSLRK